MAQQKRKPCPVCGAKMAVTRVAHAWNLWCEDDCGLCFYGREDESQAKLTERWNRQGEWRRVADPREAE